MGWVMSADIELNINPEDRPKEHTPILSWGLFFKLSVIITDNKSNPHCLWLQLL